MFEWILDNWLLLTACSGGFYLIVWTIEKIVCKHKNKSTSKHCDKSQEEVTEINVDGTAAQS